MERPRVITFALASVDGRVAMSPDRLLIFGDDRWAEVAGFASEVEKRLKEMHDPEAILEGSGSLVPDGAVPEALPPLDADQARDAKVLYEDYLPPAPKAGPGPQRWFTVVDGRGRIRWLYKQWPGMEEWRLLVLVCESTPPEYLAYLRREEICYLVAGKKRVDLRLALGRLGQGLGVRNVLAEGAARLNGVLLREGLVDEVNVEVFPALIGGTGTPSLFDSPDLADSENPLKLELVSAETRPAGRLWLRYTRAS